MKSPFVNELKPNQVIETSFLVQSKEIRQKKGGSGEFYLSLFLADRTGEPQLDTVLAEIELRVGVELAKIGMPQRDESSG